MSEMNETVVLILHKVETDKNITKTKEKHFIITGTRKIQKE